MSQHLIRLVRNTYEIYDRGRGKDSWPSRWRKPQGSALLIQHQLLPPPLFFLTRGSSFKAFPLRPAEPVTKPSLGSPPPMPQDERANSLHCSNRAGRLQCWNRPQAKQNQALKKNQGKDSSGVSCCPSVKITSSHSPIPPYPKGSETVCLRNF